MTAYSEPNSELLLTTSAPPLVGASVLLQVQPVFDGQPLELDHTPYITPLGEQVVITVCRFHLSGLVLTYADGSTYAEPHSCHLIDAAIPGTFVLTQRHTPAKPLKSLTFCVGIDSTASLSGEFGGTLDSARGIYRSANRSYFNAQLEGRSPHCRFPQREFRFHIGGTKAPYDSRRRVVLPVSGAPEVLRVQADVSLWMRRIRLAETPSVLVPGPAALAVAAGYGTMFRLEPTLLRL